MSRLILPIAGVLLLPLLILAGAPAMAQEPAPAPGPVPPAAPPAQDEELPDWPRAYASGDHTVILFQPQLEVWEIYEVLRARAAVAVQTPGGGEPRYGAIDLHARTTVDTVRREVLLEELELDAVRFSDAGKQEAAELEAIVRGIEPFRSERIMLVALDRVLAGLERTEAAAPSLDVGLDPPVIHYRPEPARLVVCMGPPQFAPLADLPLQFALNTHWDLLRDPATGRCYLLDGAGWLETDDPASGPWQPARALPEVFAQIPDDETWGELRTQVPGTAPETAPIVILSDVPAELIVTEGLPELELIEGTPLLAVSNSENDLFMHTTRAGSMYYLLAGGRWFRAEQLEGPWEAATRDLPAAFAQIPPDHPRGGVLASVPGTPEAEAAVLLASIPRRATVDRMAVTITVPWEGEPAFAPIEGTSLQQGINTSCAVLLVNGMYYCCHEGIWFASMEPGGPWVVTSRVPDAVYQIPPTSSMHEVTYVKVYDATPDTVTVGYTSGYVGEFIVAGIVVAGLVWAISEADSVSIRVRTGSSSFYYRSGSRYDELNGGFVRWGGNCGPSGGGHRWAAWNPSTGTWARGGARYGPGGAVGAREGYNPRTGRYAATAQARTPYGSWGRSVVADGDDWVRTGHRSGRRGTIAAAESSGGGGIVVGENRRGDRGFVARSADGDVYVGGDGRVYRRGSDGSWASREGGSWKSVDREGANRRKTAGRLDRERRARETGNRRTQQTRQALRGRAAPRRSGGRRGR